MVHWNEELIKENLKNGDIYVNHERRDELYQKGTLRVNLICKNNIKMIYTI